MLNFRPGDFRACQLTARIDGIDRAFLFGNGAITARLGLHPLPLVIGVSAGELGLSPFNY